MNNFGISDFLISDFPNPKPPVLTLNSQLLSIIYHLNEIYLKADGKETFKKDLTF